MSNYPKYFINNHERHIPVLWKFNVGRAVAVFPTISFCTATCSFSRIFSLSLSFSTNPPQSLPALLQQLNGQWQLLRASLVCYSGREVQRRGPGPTSAPQLSGPETWGIKLTSSQHHFIRAPNSGPGFLLANENVQESWFHTFWTQCRGGNIAEADTEQQNII